MANILMLVSFLLNGYKKIVIIILNSCNPDNGVKVVFVSLSTYLIKPTTTSDSSEIYSINIL